MDVLVFFFQAEDGIRDGHVTGVQTCALPISWTRGLRDWISSHVRAFDFFQGCTRLVVPDNWKSGVKQPCYYEPELNRTYNDLALHYGVGILPARPYHARDKDYVSYCTLSCLCRGEDRLLGRSASL